MKFIKLESRGGNYLVVASNIAWLRTAENGQTSVGMVGGQPLLVVGSIEEVAAKILAATAQEEEPAVEPVAAAPAPQVTPPAASAPEPAPAAAIIAAPAAIAPAPPEPAPPEPTLQPVAEPSLPAPEHAAPRAPLARAPERPRQVRAHSMSLADRVARAAAPKVKVETQRFMGLAE